MFFKIKEKSHLLLYASIDRITSEEIPVVINSLLTIGAKNVNFVTALGKKGRSVFLVFIDLCTESYTDVIQYLVFHLQCTGWHLLNSSHQFAVTANRTITITISLSGQSYQLVIPFKMIKNPCSNHLILLEHDYCINFYHSLPEKIRLSLSYCQLKQQLVGKIKKILKKEEGQNDQRNFISHTSG